MRIYKTRKRREGGIKLTEAEHVRMTKRVRKTKETTTTLLGYVPEIKEIKTLSFFFSFFFRRNG